MRRFSRFLTILITSFVMILAGLVASPIATAGENKTVRVSAKFSFGSSVLTKSQKAEIKKALASSGLDATFIATGVAGKLPGVSNRQVKSLAKKRAQAIKAYLLSLGVSETSVTTEAKLTKIGVDPSSVSYPTPAPTPTPTPTAVATNNAPAAGAITTCATGGTCIVGDAGPGGGIVYYVDNVGFNCGPAHTNTGSPTGGLCRYLEVAPSGWSGLYDPTKPWAITLWRLTDITGIIDDTLAGNNASGIGLGYKNSELIRTQNGAYVELTNNYAAGAARAYAGGSKTDWYLPTTAELNLLCQWNRNATQNVLTPCTIGTLNTGTGATGSGFGPDSFWSSSEKNSGFAWYQNFYDGQQLSASKGNGTVRPVRAF